MVTQATALFLMAGVAGAHRYARLAAMAARTQTEAEQAIGTKGLAAAAVGPEARAAPPAWATLSMEEA